MGTEASPPADTGPWRYGKPTDGFAMLDSSLEPNLDVGDLGYERTPIDRFFVCSVDHAVDVDHDAYRLVIGGSASTGEVRLSLADLQALPQRRMDAWLECAGNGRHLFGEVGRFAVQIDQTNTQWKLGAIAMGSWRGPTLASVLELAGVRSTAAWVSPKGLDVDNSEGEPVRMCLPLDKALDADTLIALEMNGEPLVAAHGAPARLLVPGWVGAYSVKWLERIDVADEWVGSFRSDEYYVYRDADGAPSGPVTAHPVKSHLVLPWPGAPARFDSGPRTLTGYARSGHGSITEVRWQLDDGPWETARLRPVPGRWAWTPFEIDVDPAPGHHVVRTRAADEAGNVQPDQQTPHRDGVMWSAVIPHPIEVMD